VGLESLSINYPRNTNWIGPLRKNRLIPVFLVHEFAAGGGYPFIGAFELAPLRDWIRAMTRGHVFRPSAHGEVQTPLRTLEEKSFFPD